MRWHPGSILLLLLLLAVAIGSIFWLDQPARSPEGDTLNMAQLKADYYLETFETVSYNLSGKPEYRIEGAKLLHYPTRKASLIETPHVELTREQQPTWNIHSANGWLNESNESLKLEGDVRMIRNAVENLGHIRVFTEQIQVQPKQKKLHTEADVRIVSDKWMLRSSGMESDLTQGKLTLLSNVRARYEIQ